MVDFFAHIDLELFYVGNHTLQNGLFDLLMPFLTDLNKKPLALVVVGLVWILMLLKGGKAGRLAALLLVPTIVLSDQLNSSFLKHLIERPRPCHVLPDVRLLVSCGSGYSFPSSHAVNNFAGALILSFYLPRWGWTFFLFAATVAFSRIYVGVHYPSDILAGAVVGLAVGGCVLLAYVFVERHLLNRRSPDPSNR
jgi:undecaprenyl-diphosphatase